MHKRIAGQPNFDTNDLAQATADFQEADRHASKRRATEIDPATYEGRFSTPTVFPAGFSISELDQTRRQFLVDMGKPMPPVQFIEWRGHLVEVGPYIAYYFPALAQANRHPEDDQRQDLVLAVLDQALVDMQTTWSGRNAVHVFVEARTRGMLTGPYWEALAIAMINAGFVDEKDRIPLLSQAFDSNTLDGGSWERIAACAIQSSLDEEAFKAVFASLWTHRSWLNEQNWENIGNSWATFLSTPGLNDLDLSRFGKRLQAAQDFCKLNNEQWGKMRNAFFSQERDREFCRVMIGATRQGEMTHAQN